MVKRYAFPYIHPVVGVEVYEYPDGGWVQYEDYKALKISELTLRIAKLEENIYILVVNDEPYTNLNKELQILQEELTRLIKT